MKGTAMSENVGQNKTVVYLLVAVAALLALVVGVLVWQKTSTIPAPTVQAPVQDAPSDGGSGQAPVQAAGGEFDPETAPKVPEGQTPEEYVKEYYEACDKGDYAKAYEMLPTATQAYYGDSGRFEETLKGYGIDGYELDKSTESAEEFTMLAWQATPNGSFGYQWTLVKQDGEWLVKSRDMAGMK